MTAQWFTDPFAEEVWLKKYAGNYNWIDGYLDALAHMVGINSEERWVFGKMLKEKRFSPGGRILAWAGRPTAKMSLMNCTTHQVQDDTLEAVSDATYAIMRASSRGQGIGIDLSKLRPRESPVDNAAKTSTGAISFMELLNHAGGIIGQEGRRSALLFSLDVGHPDLWRPGEQDVPCQNCNGHGCMTCRGSGLAQYDFLNIKRVSGVVENANISVNITDDFMEAANKDEWWTLKFTGQTGAEDFTVEQQVKARNLFMALAFSAHGAAEPGVLFLDTTRKLSNSDLFGPRWKVVGVNACTEQLLDQEGVCNLGSLNLSAYIKNPFTKEARFDYNLFWVDVHNAIRFLDNVLSIELLKGVSISTTQYESIEYLRRVGLGVMGLADALAMLGIEYGYNSEAVSFIENVFSLLRNGSYKASIELAKEKGRAKAWDLVDPRDIIDHGFFGTLPDEIKNDIIKYGTRNITLLSVAPTGTISNLYGVSSGIEPLFSLEYIRRYRLNGHDEFANYVHPAVMYSREMGLDDGIWQTAYQVTPEDHIRLQGLMQNYIDQAISKTTNLPEHSTVDDVAFIYNLAHEVGTKGVAVYVNGSRSKQILYQTDECPDCGEEGNIVRENGCKSCSTCGWSVCT